MTYSSPGGMTRLQKISAFNAHLRALRSSAMWSREPRRSALKFLLVSTDMDEAEAMRVIETLQKLGIRLDSEEGKRALEELAGWGTAEDWQI